MQHSSFPIYYVLIHVCISLGMLWNIMWKEKDNAIEKAVVEAIQLERERAKQTTDDERVSSILFYFVCHFYWVCIFVFDYFIHRWSISRCSTL